MFIDSFSVYLFSLLKDPITMVRAHLAEAMIIIKPFYDRNEEDALLITELVQELIQDSSQDVIDAAEQAEFDILQNRKKIKEKELINQDKQKIQF